MDADQFLQRLRNSRHYENQALHIETMRARPATYGDLPGGLHAAVAAALADSGIARLYSHQAEAITRVREGRSVVVVTGTASGKTLCYNIPVAEALAEDPLATALYLYPTKALAQDQLRAVDRFQRPGEGLRLMAGTYDGDTAANLRRRLRDGANVILTNPDMLHQGILPQHARWNRFFSNLRYVVLDEVHAYRGVFGSHVANVMRRLERICRHYGAQPQFICSSATIGNPGLHAARVTGREMVEVTNDGAPRGPRRFVLWNPPPVAEGAAAAPGDGWRTGGDRKSALWESVELMSALVQEGVQTIAFVRTRLAAEMIFKRTRDLLRSRSRRLADSIHAYRGGYLPEERREIERRLVARDIMGVASTNALELGIDIGSLDACIMVGYPGTVASLWQRAGRAGRGQEEALVVLVGQNAPVDQYLMTHSEYLFGRNPEEAVVDPENPHITIGHLRCAAHELPLSPADAEAFGPYAAVLLEMLEEEGSVRQLEGRHYWANSDYPATAVSLRNIAGPVYTIQEDAPGARVIGTMDEVSALAQLHDHAVYIHSAETYFVEKLDLEQKIARVTPRELDYYTQSIQVSQIRIDKTDEQREWRGSLLGYGDVTVTTSIPMFKKVRFNARESLGYEKLELPPQELETVATWFSPPPQVAGDLQAHGQLVGEALIGVANVLVEVAPFFVMCDTCDIGATVDAGCLGRDAVFLFDRYPGGMGYARRCLDRAEEMLAAVHEVIRQCRCEDGCPSCVGAAVPAFALTDMDGAVRDRIPDKQAALRLLDQVLRDPAR